jgi:hypothetical protein
LYLTPSEQTTADEADLRRRASSAFGDFISSLDRWDAFYTLTYDPGRSPDGLQYRREELPPPSVDAVRRHTLRWLKALPDCLGCPYVAVAATELHKSGWPHVHVLLASGGMSSRPLVGAAQLWYAKHGYAKYKPVDSALEISRYVAKYMTKQTSELTFWPTAGALAHQGSLRR